MSLILPQAHETTVRSGGYEFAFDPKAGLWLVPAKGGWFMGDDVTFATLASPLFFSSAYTRKGIAAPPVPATASPLWDAPETVVGEIIAYRGWGTDLRILADGTVGVRLRSLNNNFFWDGPVAVADDPPEADGEHGFHAVGLEAHHERNFESYVHDADVWGRVGLSGLVVEGTTGYRAERATIQELWVNPNGEDWDEDDSAEGLCLILGDRYQCDASVRIPSWKHLTAEMATAKD